MGPVTPMASLVALVATALSFFGAVAVAGPLANRQSASASGFVTPNSWLTTIPSSSYGEPLNVVISNASSSSVLSESGLGSYLSSLFFSPNNCLGLSLGDEQAADLNDGQGSRNQSGLYRYNFGLGTTTCQESINGGQHLRYWQQGSGAWFLAVSVEEGAASNHDIVDDGYDLGRNWFVGNATNSSGTTSPQDASAYTAASASTSVTIDSSAVNHGISVDGTVYVLTVTQTKAGNGTNPTASSSSSKSTSTATSGATSVTMVQRPSLLLLALIAALTSCCSLGMGPWAVSGRVVRRSPVPSRRGTAAAKTQESDPGLATGQRLSGQTNPDPVPAEKLAFYSSALPADIDDKLRTEIDSALPLAAAAYCNGTFEGTWGGSGCGPACDAVPGPDDILWHAGDGDYDPHRLLLYIRDTRTLALVTEGSSFARLLSVVNDFAFVPVPVAPSVSGSFRRYAVVDDDDGEDHDTAGVREALEDLTTGVASTLVLAHGGFEATWARLYPEVLAQVRLALANTSIPVSRILTTGHSLGAAVSLLDALALRNDLDLDVPFVNIGFGSPRVFNPIGAGLVNKVAGNPAANFTYYHVHHADDIIPHLGPLILGFQHSSHEVFLPDNGTRAVLCPGYENTRCSLGRGIRAPLNLTIDDHDGPYLGRWLLGRGNDFQCFQLADYTSEGLPSPLE